MVNSASGKTGTPATPGSDSNLARAHSSMSRFTRVVGRKLPRSTRKRPFSEGFTRLEHRAIGSEHGEPTETELDQLQRHQSTVHMPEFDASKLDHVDFDAPDGEPVQQAFEQRLRLMMLEEGSVQQVDAHYPDGFLLKGRFHIEHAYMEDDLAGIISRTRLELEAHPAMTFVRPLVATCHHSVGEGKERRRVAALCRRAALAFNWYS